MFEQDCQPEDTDRALAHIVSQTKENIALLVSLRRLSQYDAEMFLAKLPIIIPGLSSAPQPGIPPASQSGQSPLTRTVPVPSRPRLASPCVFKARARWGYNENGKEPNDLTFASGNIIEVLDQTNTDWWNGRYNGKDGLFPSSYVEILPADPPKPGFQPPVAAQYLKEAQAPVNFPNGPAYPALYPYPQQQNYHSPPPQGPPQSVIYPPYSGPPQPAPTVVMTEEQPNKKHGMFSGKLGNTLAHSAVGGAGFGAGSALAGGFVNSIF